jgi:molybdopterin-dependent oxidoreductase alpha subunit
VSLREQFGGWNPKLWAGWRPNGVGEQKPNHYRDLARAAWANRAHPAYAYRVLTRGACDGCALGVAGLHDWTIDGVHLCTTRLDLLELNTADAIDPHVLSDVAPLRSRTGGQLRTLGRLGHPMRRRRGEAGFRRVSWDEALSVLAARLRSTAPDRTALYLTSRGITNETYYVAAKAARALGIASIDSAARVCHAPSTVGLKQTIGVAATTCSFQDVIEAPLVVLWGSNPANNQPVFMKYLYLARRRGCRVVVVNPYLEPGLERYWVPSNVESALFGTRMCDLHVPVRPGGDVALANAALQRLIARGAVDRPFVDAHTEGFDEVATALARQDLDRLLALAGVDRTSVESFVDELVRAGGAVHVWSMGITQHRGAAETVRGIVNLALAQGGVGRDGVGLMPTRGHSGVQGGAEMGAYATALPGGLPVDPEHAATLAAAWGFPVPDRPGLTAPEMVEAAGRGEIDVLWMSGGNFLDVLPDPPAVKAALGRVPLRVHQDVVMTRQMLVEGDDVVLLPVATRYEQEGGGTETTTERRIVFSPEIPRRVGEARSEWRLFADVANRVRPELRRAFSWAGNADLRREIAEVVPLYAGIETLADTGDAVQWGGRHLAVGGAFPTPSGRGRFTPLEPAETEVPEGSFVVSTRRGKQFNSMVHGQVDPLTGASRDAVFMDADDAADLGLAAGDRVRLRSETGSLEGTVMVARLPARTLQVHWPEGNVLIAGGPDRREPASRVPDYNAVVTVEPLGAAEPDPPEADRG